MDYITNLHGHGEVPFNVLALVLRTWERLRFLLLVAAVRMLAAFDVPVLDQVPHLHRKRERLQRYGSHVFREGFEFLLATFVLSCGLAGLFVE